MSIDFNIKMKHITRGWRSAKQMNFADPTKTAIQRGLFVSGHQVVDHIRQEARARKTGRKYYYYKGKHRYVHIASSPEETSARRSGLKSKMTSFEVKGKKLIIGVDRQVKYGAYIEFGTAIMAPRHDLERGIKKNIFNIKSNILEMIDRMFK